jgi:hypothetical protein
VKEECGKKTSTCGGRTEKRNREIQQHNLTQHELKIDLTRRRSIVTHWMKCTTTYQTSDFVHGVGGRCTKSILIYVRLHFHVLCGSGVYGCVCCCVCVFE